MIYIDDRQNKIDVPKGIIDKINEIIKFALIEEKVKYECEISIIFVDNAMIRKLNSKYRNIDRETDILSFPMLFYPPHKVFKDVYLNKKIDISSFDGEDLVLGDIALSVEKAENQSIEYNHSFEREVIYLIIHSVLHLLGYDHIEDVDKKIMRKREEEILQKFDITR